MHRIARSSWSLLSLRASCAAAHDIPERRDRSVVRQARRASGCNCWCACRCSAMRDVEFPGARPAAIWISNGSTPLLPDAATLWIADFVEIYEGDDARCRSRASSATQVSLRIRPVLRVVRPGARARHRAEARRTTRTSVWNQVLLDVLFEYPIHSDRSRVFHPPRARAAGGAAWSPCCASCRPAARCAPIEFTGDPGLVRLDPRWHQAALRFVELGFCHILDGTDHLLFLLLPGDSVPPLPRR